ncbi:IS6 family transposase, partial [Burkholderia ubonensis]|uniref:IS6 family transposase n=1 Tax=Burkholderia ubonensis TaxID=101571 RepID=UPI000752CAA3
MKTNQVVRSAAESRISFKGYRFPPDIISDAVWLYYRFPLSLRMVEELLAARGIELTYETVRSWAPERGDKWRLDEVVVTINGTKHWLWRAVDPHGAVLEVLVQRRRDQAAAKRLMRKLLKRHGRPRVIVTDKLRSYAAANTELGLSVEHRQHKGLNNRAENSRQPTRVREKVMRRFKSARQLQRFASVHGQVSNLFMGCRHQHNAQHKREARA